MTDREECLLWKSSVPYRNYPGVTMTRAETYYLHRLNSSTGTVIGNPVVHTAVLNRLDWDSAILGIKCGRIDFVAASKNHWPLRLAIETIEKAKDLDIDHLSVRFDLEDEHLIDGFQTAMFEKVDTIQTFVATAREKGAESHGIRLANLADANAVREIARTAFTVDRFHSDPLIPKDRADELHAQWGENSVLGKAADTVVVAYEGEEVLGFVTCKVLPNSWELLGVKLGTIVLVATAEKARGQGFATKMVEFALDWFAKQGCHVVDVGTQGDNRAASKLYENLGFRQVGSSVSLRWAPPLQS